MLTVCRIFKLRIPSPMSTMGRSVVNNGVNLVNVVFKRPLSIQCKLSSQENSRDFRDDINCQVKLNALPKASEALQR